MKSFKFCLAVMAVAGISISTPAFTQTSTVTAVKRSLQASDIVGLLSGQDLSTSVVSANGFNYTFSQMFSLLTGPAFVPINVSVTLGTLLNPWITVYADSFQLSISYTVTTLPACNVSLTGKFLQVSDATSPTYNGVLTGGGAITVPVYCNGSSWTAH